MMESTTRFKKSKKSQKKLLLQVDDLEDIKGSVGEELHHLDLDKTIVTDEDETRRRRTLELHNTSGTWGFTLQTYGVRHKETGQVDVNTYIDYVEGNSPAWLAGIRRGDIIIAVNGESVESKTHKQLVDVIKKCGETMRLVVLFDDCCKKVELHDRFFKLKALLKVKLQELRTLETKEIKILHGNPFLLRSDVSRASLMSTASSVASWDKFSMVSSPYSLEDVTSPYYGSKENLFFENDSDSLSCSSFSLYDDKLDHSDKLGTDKLDTDKPSIADSQTQKQRKAEERFNKKQPVRLLNYKKLNARVPYLYHRKHLNSESETDFRKIVFGRKMMSMSASCADLMIENTDAGLGGKRSISQVDLSRFHDFHDETEFSSTKFSATLSDIGDNSPKVFDFDEDDVDLYNTDTLSDRCKTHHCVNDTESDVIKGVSRSCSEDKTDIENEIHTKVVIHSCANNDSNQFDDETDTLETSDVTICANTDNESVNSESNCDINAQTCDMNIGTKLHSLENDTMPMTNHQNNGIISNVNSIQGNTDLATCKPSNISVQRIQKILISASDEDIWYNEISESKHSTHKYETDSNDGKLPQTTDSIAETCDSSNEAEIIASGNISMSKPDIIQGNHDSSNDNSDSFE